MVECRLVVDARSRASRGFAFITMDSVAMAEKCMKYLNGATLDGRVITVERVLYAFPMQFVLVVCRPWLAVFFCPTGHLYHTLVCKFYRA